MPILPFVLFAVIQGFAKFLPLSPSAHLALVPMLVTWQDVGPAVRLAVDLGALAAVALFLVRDIGAMANGLWRNLRGRSDPGARLFGQVFAATVPVTAAILLRDHYGADALRGLATLAWATIGFAVFLLLADGIGMTVRRIEHLQLSDAVVVGIAQIAALVPGAGRATVAMAAARVLGFERRDAARFSMILALPALAGSALFDGWQTHLAGEPLLTAHATAAGGLAFACALIAIAGLMAWLRKHSFAPFAVYRLLLGTGLLGFAYGWY